MSVSVNDHRRMLRPAIYQLKKESAEYARWFDEDNVARPRPLDSVELARFFARRGMELDAARKKVADESQAKRDDKAIWLAVQNPLVDRMIEAMRAEIEKHGLEVMQRYPNDILIHDRNMLLCNAAPGSRFAWTVHDTSSHLAVLGIHPDLNSDINAFVNHSDRQRFYELRVNHGSFSLNEIDERAFLSLRHVSVPYHSTGRGSFRLLRGDTVVGHVRLDDVGNWQDRRYKVTITPDAQATARDLVALDAWSVRETVRLAGTLFVRSTMDWIEPQALRQAA